MTTPRPRSIPGLLARLLWLYRRTAVLVLGLGLLALAVGLRACPDPELRVATFNIRNFPENPAQIEGAFATIAALDVPLVAVQEITDTRAFAAAARRQLGKHWRAEFGPHARRERIVQGVLYDAATFELDYARLHRQTKRFEGGRATLEVRLFSRVGGPALRVFVVHLKSGAKYASTRARQIAALTPLLRRAARGRDEVVILGDFNSTGERDRRALARFAHDTGLSWATDALACTSYWKPGGKCQGSALDHVFTSRPAREAAARGPCESVGCEPGDSCPVFYDEVSDHCPVSAAF